MVSPLDVVRFEADDLQAAFIAVFVGILTVFVAVFLFPGLFKNKPRNFVLVGPKESGKTNLFSLLTTGKLPELTVTSIEPSEGALHLSDSNYEEEFTDVIVRDFPASSKMKSLYLLPFLKDNVRHCKGTVYLLDASAFDTSYCYKVASDLLELLQITESIPNGVDMVVFCNKCDYFTSKKPEKIKQLLQQEITRQYSLKLKGLDKVSEDGEGIEEVLNASFNGGEFRFEMLEGNVDFVEGNLFKNKIEPLQNWFCEKAAN